MKRWIPLLLWLGCRGPQPEVLEATLGRAPEPGKVRVEALLRNHGGDGQVSLDVRLIERDSGRVIEEEKSVEMQRHEQQRFVSDLAAPPGNYRVEVKAEYPPE
jgi:hypothetical protein